MATADYRNRTHVVAREGNVIRVEFTSYSEPPEPTFPGAGALRDHLTLISPEGGERPLHIAA
jgi:hypothetical protein